MPVNLETPSDKVVTNSPRVPLLQVPSPRYHKTPTLVSASRGKYAISLQGSNREYLEALEKMFCAAPISTAAYRGVRPAAASVGVSGPLKSTREKKITPAAAERESWWGLCNKTGAYRD